MLYYETTNREYKNTSRYQTLRVIREIEDKVEERYLETYNQKFVPEHPRDVYHVVKSNEVGRLDIISNEYYGTPTYWWAIALANEFIDPFILNVGDLIRIPTLTSLSDIDNEILTRKGAPSYNV